MLLLLVKKEQHKVLWKEFVGHEGDHEGLLMLIDTTFHLLGASFKQKNDNNRICILERLL